LREIKMARAPSRDHQATNREVRVMTVLQLALVILNALAFAAFVLTLSAVSLQAAAGEGPVMRRSPRLWDRRIAR